MCATEWINVLDNLRRELCEEVKREEFFKKSYARFAQLVYPHM